MPATCVVCPASWRCRPRSARSSRILCRDTTVGTAGCRLRVGIDGQGRVEPGDPQQVADAVGGVGQDQPARGVAELPGGLDEHVQSGRRQERELGQVERNVAAPGEADSVEHVLQDRCGGQVEFSEQPQPAARGGAVGDHASGRCRLRWQCSAWVRTPSGRGPRSAPGSSPEARSRVRWYRARTGTATGTESAPHGFGPADLDPVLSADLGCGPLRAGGKQVSVGVLDGAGGTAQESATRSGCAGGLRAYRGHDVHRVLRVVVADVDLAT